MTSPRLFLLKVRKTSAPATYWLFLIGLSLEVGFILGSLSVSIVALAVLAVAFEKFPPLHRFWMTAWGLEDELAAEYQKAGRDAEAETYYKQWLLRVDGLDDPILVDGLFGFAVLLSGQHRYQEAEPFYRRVLMIEEKTLGPDHEKVKRDRANLERCSSDARGSK